LHYSRTFTRNEDGVLLFGTFFAGAGRDDHGPSLPRETYGKSKVTAGMSRAQFPLPGFSLPGQGTCGLAFLVVRIDPETLATEEVLVHSGTVLGSVSSALAIGDTLNLGSFSSDRMARPSYTP